MKVIKIVGLVSGSPTPHDDKYLVSFDFEQDTLHGLTSSRNHAEARKFKSSIEALNYWTTESTTHPVRLFDGKPNRPFTGYSVVIQEADVNDPNAELAAQLLKIISGSK